MSEAKTVWRVFSIILGLADLWGLYVICASITDIKLSRDCFWLALCPEPDVQRCMPLRQRDGELEERLVFDLR
ncbi:hypothetical protein B0T26DRAFT_682467 [Lasiosphaeria miniovina]|uniref:Uncharacterized protein n=1 Tax=Lasiosphaeria miniovina TaxID=1954250 RepID=A0AA40BEX5_9PEZI|nr:uncharacterized protein B0T26DRAFT_682467 [Lasiosphaeria miniovina]KAK0732972.1 hypothetical protein B0T26DRAFT_682467 [Lasiosphaeria miniovina]